MPAATVAQIILQQLGGNKFAAMTGAKLFVGRANGLSFRLPGKPGYTKEGINFVRITLDPSDTYTVEFIKMQRTSSDDNGENFKTIETLSDVYNEDLQEVFTRETGLATRL